MAQKPIGFYGKFTPTSIDNTVGDRFKALAGLSSEVGQLAVGIGKAKAAADAPEQAAAAVEEAITIDPETGQTVIGEVKKRSSFAWGNAQFNQSLTTGIMARLENDYTANIPRIALESQGDLELFDAKIKGYLQATKGFENLPVEIQNASKSYLQSYRKQVATENTKRTIAQDQSDRALYIKTGQENTLKFVAQNDLEAAADSYKATVLGIQAGVGIDYSQNQANHDISVLQADYKTAQARAEVIGILENSSDVAAWQYLEKQIKAMPKEFTPDQRDAYEAAIETEIKQHITNENIKENEAAEGRALRQEANATNISIGISNGTANRQDIDKADISFTQRNTLVTQYQNRGKGIDNYVVLGEIERLIYTNPKQAKELIASSLGNSISQQTANKYNAILRDDESSGKALQTEQAIKFASHLRENVMDTSAFAIVDKKERVLASELNIVFTERVLAGEDPAKVAYELIEASAPGKAISSGTGAPPYFNKSAQESNGPNSDLQKEYAENNITDEQFDDAVEENKAWEIKVNAYNRFITDYDKIIKGQ